MMKPGLFHVKVFHDEWCNLLSGKGECNCHPETITFDWSKMSQQEKIDFIKEQQRQND
jgi:hypothetical protein